MDLAFNDLEADVAKTFQVILEREATIERVRQAETSDTGVDQRLWQLLTGAGAIDIAVAEDGGGLFLAGIVAELTGEHLAPVPFSRAACAFRALAGSELELAAEIASGTKLVSVATADVELSTGGRLVPGGSVADAALVHNDDGLWLQEKPTEVVRATTLDSGSTAVWPAVPTDQMRLIAAGDTAETIWAALQTDLRVLAAAELVGMAHRAVTIAAEYACTRSQFGRFIGSYQGVSHPLADAATAIAGARLLTQKAAWSVDESESDRDTTAAMAFVNAWEVAQRAVTHSLRVHGGYGFMNEYDVQLYYRRVKALPLLIGDRVSELDRLGDLFYGSEH